MPDSCPPDLAARCLLASGSGLVYWAGVLIQGRRIRKRIRKSPNLRPKTSRERILWLGWMVVILGWILQPAAIAFGWHLPGLELRPACAPPWSLWVGALLVIAGYAATLWCYAAMGSAWRIGIDPAERNQLVTSGPFARIRHPIYAFQSLMLTGCVFLLPTLLSLLLVLFHLGLVIVKSADEESYLLSIHGDAYRDYKKTSGRLLPRLFRGR